jgi:hypothetical protein
MENTTRLGCGYDFRLRTETQKDFLAVEVKGLKERAGNLSLKWPNAQETGDKNRSSVPHRDSLSWPSFAPDHVSY